MLEGGSRGGAAGQARTWWMVTMTVRLLRLTFLTARITMAAARASSPLVGSLQGARERGGWAQGVWARCVGQGGGGAGRAPGMRAGHTALGCPTPPHTHTHTHRHHHHTHTGMQAHMSSTPTPRSLHEHDRRVGHQLHADGQALALLHAQPGATCAGGPSAGAPAVATLPCPGPHTCCLALWAAPQGRRTHASEPCVSGAALLASTARHPCLPHLAPPRCCP